MDDRALIRSVADRLEALAARTTAGDWRTSGLLASRPEIVAHRSDGGTEHVAEARERTAAWLTALSPAVAPHLVTLLRVAGAADRLEPAAIDLARVLDTRLDRSETSDG